MEKNLYIVRCGEVALKGMNKPYFERVLLERVKNALSCYEGAEAKWIEGLMFVRVPENIPEDEVISKCVRVFGVASVSPAVEAPKDINEIGAKAAEFMQKVIETENIRTFKVKGKRADKSFAIESPEIARQVGGMVLKACKDFPRQDPRIRRSASRNERKGAHPDERRYRQPGRGIHDGKARHEHRSRTLPLISLHQPAGAEKG